MTETMPKILEGVFAISKPPSLSSAQVLRDLQNSFASSKTFAPLLEDVRRKQEEQERHQPKRRKRGNDAPFKMGHGGTLDPLATGVLIVGIGRGTKHLQNFLGCTKTYDTVVLFGKSTDTYDIAGKVVGDAEYKHVTRELVESKLGQFRGTIRQVPPVYSALKINGMKAYEYAREGKELPRELESREMQVDECTLLDWYEGGQHDFRWPAEEAPEDEKKAVSKLIGMPVSPATPTVKILSPNNGDDSQQDVEPHPTDSGNAPRLAEPVTTSTKSDSLTTKNKAILHTHDHTLALSDTPAPSPAARLRLTVSSGFYVRSFAHDLGLACSSYGIMASLLRSRQATFTVSSPPDIPDDQTSALTYADIQAGEGTWGPVITAQLTKWMENNPAPDGTQHVNGRDPDTRQRIADEQAAKPRQRFRGEWIARDNSKADRKRQQGGNWKGKWNQGGNRGKMHQRADRQGQGETLEADNSSNKKEKARMRNSSSPE